MNPPHPSQPQRLLQPVQRFSPETLLAAQGTNSSAGALGVKVCFFDVDGVLTDGSLWIGAEGEVVKAFHALDGHGLKLLAQGGVTPVVITGRDSAAVRRRVADLGLAHAHYGVQDKVAAAQAVLADLKLDWGDSAAMGDDWPDLPLLQRVGFACVPPGAHTEVRALAHHVTAAPAGMGAVRECCDLLLIAKGAYAALLNGHLTTLDAR
ncbi:MAG: 3-deoxy-D-manno-octulosonate 8-phosphate phosphatase [Betaproteobacteria bacterium]|nr:3-deoxy-D-manno-octulosonate 8-phosphate phosphatase [Betaproteobacteria bacterium]